MDNSQLAQLILAGKNKEIKKLPLSTLEGIDWNNLYLLSVGEDNLDIANYIGKEVGQHLDYELRDYLIRAMTGNVASRWLKRLVCDP